MADDLQLRRERLLEQAAELGIRLKNVPDQPSAAWLSKAEEKVQAAAAAAATGRRRRRLETLLADARSVGIALKNVPTDPSDAWLDKAEAKVRPLVEARQRTVVEDEAPTPPPAQRLVAPPTPPPEPAAWVAEAVLGRAAALGVKVRNVPANPSQAWLGKLVEQLDRLEAQRRPKDPTATFDASARPDPGERTARIPPVPHEASQTLDGPVAPVSVAEPLHRAVDGEAQEARALADQVQELVARAARARLDIGRVPPNPTEEWVATTTATLEAELARKKEAQRLERFRLHEERRRRVRLLIETAQQIGVELGPIPPFPTEDWIGRAELMLFERGRQDQSAQLRVDRLRHDQQRRERLEAVLRRAKAGRFDVGEVPLDPEDTWLEGAEAKLDRWESGHEVVEVEASTEAGTAAGAARLVYEEGTLQEQVFPLEGEEATIGRNRGNLVQIRNDAQISRQHARLRRGATGWTVEDLGSTRGTSVNGRKLTGPSPLADGDVVQVGETQLVFRA